MDQRTCKGQQSQTLAGPVDSPSSIPASSSGNCRSRKPFGQLVSCLCFFYLKPTLRGCWQWGRRRGGAPTDLLLLLESRRWHCAPGDDHDDRDHRDEEEKEVDVGDESDVDYVGVSLQQGQLFRKMIWNWCVLWIETIEKMEDLHENAPLRISLGALTP